MTAAVPPMTDALRKRAREQPNSWIACVDPFFGDETSEVPAHGIVGWYWVAADGGLTGDYHANDQYKASPVAQGMAEPRSPLERAIQLHVTGYGPVSTVYEEFLIADLLLVTSEDSPTPVAVKMEGQERDQYWTCTDRTAIPDFAPGTTRVLGYQLVPGLMENNVHIATPSGCAIMLVGPRAVKYAAPEITDEMRAEARERPGEWLAVPDRMFRDESVSQLPEKAIVGQYKIQDDGELTTVYWPNPAYQPSPVTMGFPEPASDLEKVLHLFKTGYVGRETLTSSVCQQSFALLVAEDGTASAFPREGSRPMLVASSATKYVPDFAKNVQRATVASLRPVLEQVDLLLDLGARHQVEISGSVLLEALKESEPLEPGDRFLGSMLAGAVGDALGFGIEFQDLGMIRRQHGEAGLRSPVLREGQAQISDDTQMMLFTVEGLIRAHVARRFQPSDRDPIPEVQHAYQRWFHTQNQPWERAGGPYARALPNPDGWLISHRELFSPRAPGSTCMSALAKFAETHEHATPSSRINDSKGCGGVMRAAPVAVWSHDPAEVFQAAVGTAALTHSHPSGFLPAGVLAVIVHQLLRDVSLADGVRMARELLMRSPEHEETMRALDGAVALAESGAVEPETLKGNLGEGWTGEEALAIGLYAVMATDDLRSALLLSVNHSGDSDSTGIVCGNIGGALYGDRAIPAEWLEVLELRDLIRTLSRDALAEFSPTPPVDHTWTERYPAW